MMRADIEQFLAEKSVGVAGVSRTGAKFSNKVYEKLKESGYDVHLVHPEAAAIGDDGCVASIRELPSEVRALIVVAGPDVCARVLGDVSGTGIKRVWVFSGAKVRPDIEAEMGRLKGAGVSVIWGFCPFMFLEPVSSVHAVHRFFVRLFGRYPG